MFGTSIRSDWKLMRDYSLHVHDGSQDLGLQHLVRQGLSAVHTWARKIKRTYQHGGDETGEECVDRGAE